MATQVSQGKSPSSRDRVSVRLITSSGYQQYWRPEDLIYQFEFELQDLMYHAGLRGTFEAKQAGRRIAGSGTDGITLGRASDFIIEFQAEYGASRQKDIWTISFHQKDTAGIYNRLTRALAGEILSSILDDDIEEALPKVVREKQEKKQREPVVKHLPPESGNPLFQKGGTVLERDPVGIACCLVFLYGYTDDRNCVPKSVLTDIAMDYYDVPERRRVSAVHKAMRPHNMLRVIKEVEYYFNPEALALITANRERVMALEKFQTKLAELEVLSQGNPKQAATADAARALLRIRELLKE
ncbi:MAG: hypothetical protein KIH67_001525 [Candidatus Moranbacteria bacterium]|nr:hypothetical protein [Candidatus Moranbacteria bacterium]